MNYCVELKKYFEIDSFIEGDYRLYNMTLQPRIIYPFCLYNEKNHLVYQNNIIKTDKYVHSNNN